MELELIFFSSGGLEEVVFSAGGYRGLAVGETREKKFQYEQEHLRVVRFLFLGASVR